jgi:cytochrome c oxidase assembly factor CtaG
VVTPDTLAAAWSWDPLILTALIAGSWWYATGVRALWRSAGRGKVVTTGQAAAFCAAMITFAAALLSPLDRLGAALFSAHMTQHVLLTLVAAPLLVLSSPLQTMAWGLPSRLRRRAGRWGGRLRRLLAHPALPGFGLAVFSLVLLSWHVPVLYDAALASDVVHALEHVTMTGAAVALWTPIIRPRRTNAGFGVVLLFISLIVSGALAALLVFSPSPWYAHPTPVAWGVTRLADQQLAGAVMWVLGGALHVVAGALVLMAWLRADERSVLRRERHAPAMTRRRSM